MKCRTVYGCLTPQLCGHAHECIQGPSERATSGPAGPAPVVAAVATSSASVDDLATLVRRLVYELRKLNPDSICASDSLDYLTRHGLIRSPMRKPNIADLPTRDERAANPSK